MMYSDFCDYSDGGYLSDLSDEDKWFIDFNQYILFPGGNDGDRVYSFCIEFHDLLKQFRLIGDIKNEESVLIPSEKFRYLHETVRSCAIKQHFTLIDRFTIAAFLLAIEEDYWHKPKEEHIADPARCMHEEFDMNKHYPPNTHVEYCAFW